MAELKTKIGLEIHVQLKTKAKMFCRCDNNAEGKAPNSVVCPVCLALPGALPVANKQAILWTIKTGLALKCEIPEIAKFDRKHYFYPDLPKGYQISQYDEPFCVGGYLEIGGRRIRLNRIHLEEDAGKLIHHGNKSYVDLNRAGTPLMEIVTEPDITSPKEAGEFLRKLQKIVRDVVEVSEASMEKGHMRCDANISVNDGEKMSQIIELKNLNSFKFVEKALILVDAQLCEDYGNWPEKNSKETWGYNSDDNKVYLQRRKEEAADYRYFPEPDLPPFNTAEFDLDLLRAEIGENEEVKIGKLAKLGIAESDAKILVSNKNKLEVFNTIIEKNNEADRDELIPIAAKVIVNNYFGFEVAAADQKIDQYAKAIRDFAFKGVIKNAFTEIVTEIRDTDKSYEHIFDEKHLVIHNSLNLEPIIEQILADNLKEAERYKAGEQQLLGFFVGQVKKATQGKGDPAEISKILKVKLDQ